MPWIENVAAADIPTGFHHDAGPNSMLISIVGHGYSSIQNRRQPCERRARII